MQLLDQQHTDGDRPAFEKFIVEDYILDTMMAFEEKRAECAKQLAQGNVNLSSRIDVSRPNEFLWRGMLLILGYFVCYVGLPVPFAFEPLLCQTIFSQMLGLPKPQYRPVMYSALMVDLCKLCKLFPRAMSACVRSAVLWVM